MESIFDINRDFYSKNIIDIFCNNCYLKTPTKHFSGVYVKHKETDLRVLNILV